MKKQEYQQALKVKKKVESERMASITASLERISQTLNLIYEMLKKTNA